MIFYLRGGKIIKKTAPLNRIRYFIGIKKTVNLIRTNNSGALGAKL